MDAFSPRTRGAASCLGRRRFMRAAAVSATAGLLPVRAAAQIKEPRSGVTLTEFMALSHRLTEAPDLSAELGRLYFDSLQRSSRGAIHREALLADPRTILTLWYTGLYDAPDGRPAAAEFIDALAWRAVGYTTAPSECKGTTNYWADPPDQAASK